MDKYSKYNDWVDNHPIGSIAVIMAFFALLTVAIMATVWAIDAGMPKRTFHAVAPDCAYEDSYGEWGVCDWNAQTRGNETGRSFVVFGNERHNWVIHF